VVLCGAALLSAPASAQDMPGALNLPDLARTQTQSSAMHSHAERDRRGPRASRTAQTCANVPRVRARLGANDPRVQRLAYLCKKAGY